MQRTCIHWRSSIGWIGLCIALSWILQAAASEGRYQSTGSAQAELEATTFSGTVTANARLFFHESVRLPIYMGHTATPLPDGTVLIVGGWGVTWTSVYKEIYLYDPDTGSSTQATTLPGPRGDHSATLLNDGSVLIAGGRSGDGGRPNHHNEAYLYHPSSRDVEQVGNMTSARAHHSAIKLQDGRVLMVGGYSASGALKSAEIYDPATRSFSPTGSMQQTHNPPVATLLASGQVLVVGGSSGSTAELYDPAAGSFSATGNLSAGNDGQAGAQLPDGSVLVVGSSKIDRYDPQSGSFLPVGTLMPTRYNHTATTLAGGKVVIAGGIVYGGPDDIVLDSVVIYDPESNSLVPGGHMQRGHYYHEATLLQDGRVLISGGETGPSGSNIFELGAYAEANTFSGQLSAPSGWIRSRNITLGVSGSTTDATLAEFALSNDGTAWGPWSAISAGTPVSTSWELGLDGAAKLLYLALRDSNGLSATVVSGTLQLDTTAPSSSMTALPAQTAGAILLSWAGSDATSGVAGYDLQVRAGSGGAWTTLMSGTRAGSTTYYGQAGSSYYFRVRAIDAAGNVEDWPASYDASTTITRSYSAAVVSINHNALATTAPAVQLWFAAQELQPGVSRLRLRVGEQAWGAWQPYTGRLDYTLPAGDGLKTLSVEFEDSAGNRSAPVSATIMLDTAAGTQRLVSINTGALWSNTTEVRLTIGAPADTIEMQVSNDGGFGGAVWQPFDTRPTWSITPYGSYAIQRTVYVRLRDSYGSISEILSDDIIYDPVPPVGTLRVVVPNSTTLEVQLQAQDPDNLSGVQLMRVGRAETFEQTAWEPYTTSKQLTISSGDAQTVSVYAQFQDGAGNISETVCATASGAPCYKYYLPLTGR